MRLCTVFCFLLLFVADLEASNHPYFVIEREHGFSGPGGLYGYCEVSGPASQQMGVFSIMIVADRQLRLPFRIGHAVMFTVLSTLAATGFFYYRRRHGRRESQMA
jgi:hypothetical protein